MRGRSTKPVDIGVPFWTASAPVILVGVTVPRRAVGVSVVVGLVISFSCRGTRETLRLSCTNCRSEIQICQLDPINRSRPIRSSVPTLLPSRVTASAPRWPPLVAGGVSRCRCSTRSVDRYRSRSVDSPPLSSNSPGSSLCRLWTGYRLPPPTAPSSSERPPMVSFWSLRRPWHAI